MEATRDNWNDERMDEFARRTESNFAEVRTEIRDLRAEMNQRFLNFEEKFDRRFDLMFGAMITGFVGLVISHFIG